MQLKSPRSIKKVTIIIEFQPLQSYKKNNYTARKRCSYLWWLMRIVNKQRLITWLYLLAATPSPIFPTTNFQKQKKGAEKLVMGGRQSRLIRQFVILKRAVWSDQLFFRFCSVALFWVKSQRKQFIRRFWFFCLSQKCFVEKNKRMNVEYVNCFIALRILENNDASV